MQKPPLTNRGAEITAPSVTIPLENRLLIDWISGTFTDIEDPLEAVDRLGLCRTDFVNAARGANGYKEAIVSGKIKILFNGQKNMGVHFTMSGDGCREYESHFPESPWLPLFSVIKASKGNITRLDLANDNIDGSLRLDLIQDSIDNHEVRTLFKRGKKVEEFTYHDESALNGKTIYLSRSRESLVYPRIYDKAAQHGLSGHWVRFEIELKGQRAMKAAQYLLDGVPVGELFFSIVNTYFAIINLDDSNKSRCSLKSWWSAWLESTNKIKLTVSKLIKKIDQVKLWFQKSVSPSLATIRKSFNNDGLFADYMKGILLDGRNRMSRKHEQILLNSKEMAINLPF